MERRTFIRNTAIGSAGLVGASSFSPFSAQASNNEKVTPLIGNRFLTLCIMIRTTPWEVSRDVKLIKQDESKFHTLKVVRDLREAFAVNNPDIYKLIYSSETL